MPGPVDAVTATEHGDVVQVRAPRVGGGYRLIVEPWRVVDVLERVGVRRRAARQRAERFPWQATVDRMLDVHAAVTDGVLVPA